VGNTEEENKRREAAAEDWWRMMMKSKRLSDDAEGEELEREAELFEEVTREMLNRQVKRIELCVRSKRWWSEDIAQKRWDLGRIKRLGGKGEHREER
jgi:ketol-acid reductoisomerase